MILRLPFGRDAVTADLRGLRCRLLEPSAPRAAESAATLAGMALDRPVGARALTELAAGRRRVVVLVPDATRRAFLPEVLPMILERLGRGGVAASSVTVLVATGTHPATAPDALAALIGSVPEGVRVVQHDSRDRAALTRAGVTPSGLEVRLHSAVLEADLVLAVSAVAHHYFAGFGGGPKLLFPGVAGYEEIQANHSRVIDLAVHPPRRHPACEPGVLEGNPVAEEIAAAAALRLPDLALLQVAGADGRPAWMIAGTMERTFPLACDRARAWYEVEAGPFDRIVVAAGGFPSDNTLVQAHKALDAACRFAAPDAEVLFVASCDGGPGSSDVAPFLADPRPDAIVARLAQRYVQYGHTTLRLIEKTARFRVSAVTRLPADQAEALGFRVVADTQSVLDRWRDEAPGAVVGVTAGAPVYPRIRAAV
ncbi:MAG: lactate racemase domain-containing protein [Acidobacteriota bacterium]